MYFKFALLYKTKCCQITKIKRLLESFLELSYTIVNYGYTKFFPLETHCFALTIFKQINYVEDDETATL